MLAARYSHRSTAHKNFIFSIGGIGAEQEVMSSMERYDSICNVWESMACMPVGVLHPAVAVKDQRLYLFGGEDIMQNPVRLIQVKGWSFLSCKCMSVRPHTCTPIHKYTCAHSTRTVQHKCMHLHMHMCACILMYRHMCI